MTVNGINQQNNVPERLMIRKRHVSKMTVNHAQVSVFTVTYRIICIVSSDIRNCSGGKNCYNKRIYSTCQAFK